MRIRVYYLGQLKLAAGHSSEEVERAESCSVAELVHQLAQRHGSALARFLLDERGGVQPALLLFVGEEQVRSATVKVKDGDEVTLVSPIAGG